MKSTFVTFLRVRGNEYAEQVIATGFAAFLLLAAFATAQQAPLARAAGSSTRIAEPSLPVIAKNACPFEGCTFREWAVEKNSTMYSTWKNGRKAIGHIKPGEKVHGLTGVYITRKPDRFKVLKPVAGTTLAAGDVVLQYAEWGEGYSDLWFKGEWHKDYGWGNSDVFQDDNTVQIAHGIKEWWVHVKKADGQTGWVLVNGNFGGMDALAENTRQRILLVS